MIVGVRHALVWNPDHVVYARLPGFHLAPEGREAACGVAADLASTPVSAVYASPLERAVETAGLLADPHGLPVLVDERLTEWGFWVRWQGLPWDRVRERDPHLLERYRRDPASVGGEDTLDAAADRVLAWSADAERRHGAGGLVLGVSHAAPLEAALLRSEGGGMDGFHGLTVCHLGMVRLRPEPAAMVEVSEVAAAVG